MAIRILDDDTTPVWANVHVELDVSFQYSETVPPVR